MNTPANNPQENLELRIRNLRVLWLGLLGSLGGFFVLTFVVEPPEDLEPNQTLFLVLVGIALTTTLVSFVVKKRFFNRALAERKVELVQQGFIMAAAVNEVGAMAGLFYYFRTGDRYAYVLLLIAVCGLLLHFPRREHVLNASFRETSDSTVGYGL